MLAGGDIFSPSSTTGELVRHKKDGVGHLGKHNPGKKKGHGQWCGKAEHGVWGWNRKFKIEEFQMRMDKWAGSRPSRAL